MRLLTGAAVAAVLSFQAVQTEPTTRVDAVFSRWTAATPGCAVGVGLDGRPVLQRAYGMADLEHDVPNAPESIFEAGSVSKQFTAAAVLLLAKDGKLSLDDPVRKYVPELPDYGAPLTIRHMLTHTSGLRDWGSIEGIAGWPRTTRTYTHAHVLDIVSRQKALNFTPGTAWSYSNTGYNLAAVIVLRVSGMTLAAFTRDRIFVPLGMTHTSWREDFTRIVKGRTIAYDLGPAGYRQEMPFENVYGNGGLLTTVGDLLKWNENFVTPVVGDAAFVALQQTPGTFNDGRAHNYAFGLSVGKYRGVPEVSHSGSTAGYRAFLVRYPEQHVSVAVLCNAGDANATQFAHAAADVYMGSRFSEPVATPSVAGATAAGGRGRGAAVPPSAADLTTYPGRYVSDEAETEFVAAIDGGALVLKQRPDRVVRLSPIEKDVFAGAELGTVTFRRTAEGRVTGLSIKQDRVWDLRFERR